jgi:hypothetical protein
MDAPSSQDLLNKARQSRNSAVNMLALEWWT